MHLRSRWTFSYPEKLTTLLACTIPSRCRPPASFLFVSSNASLVDRLLPTPTSCLVVPPSSSLIASVVVGLAFSQLLFRIVDAEILICLILLLLKLFR
ncbi:hypothetical protein FA13DRAFT_1332311 [Coprinellus micaceus]|uniref:Uncharacterized protein n=1 Tax=Coprinellus micaceus TaxID=71717 RepID=A0A4Y7TMY5_COPMI|nr:hypothetical protein FA13DRAFT_1332311 [Coprinellus micaceus]